MELDPIDFFPRYDPYFTARRRANRFKTFISICTHLLAMLLAVGICAGAFYYYDHYMKNGIDNFFIRSKRTSTANSLEDKAAKIDNIIKDMRILKDEIEETVIWRKHLDDLFSKIYLDQEAIMDGKVEKAIDLYDADKIGLFDYASIYAYGSIVSIPETVPYPANQTISFFNLLNVEISSSPESLLQPSNVPGNCFAFYGSRGNIRIKLGSPIRIKAVTLDHIKLLQDTSSAPKDFEVFGLRDPVDMQGVFLGRFTYDLNGRPYQTFKVEQKHQNQTQVFEYVELSILSNHGREEFTCVYRFRVHNREPKSS